MVSVLNRWNVGKRAAAVAVEIGYITYNKLVHRRQLPHLHLCRNATGVDQHHDVPALKVAAILGHRRRRCPRGRRGRRRGG